jgi:subtilisin family serine protease
MAIFLVVLSGAVWTVFSASAEYFTNVENLAAANQSASANPDLPTFPSHARHPVAGQYIVTFTDDEKDPAGLVQKLTDSGNISSDEVLYTYTTALKGFAAKLTTAQATALEHNPHIKSIEPDVIIELDGTETSPPSWGIDRVDQHPLPVDHTYNYNNDGTGVNVYVLDTGVRATHQEFGGRVTGGINFIADPVGTPVDPTATGDCYGHGTHVAGTIGGATVGVAKNVQIHPVRVMTCSGTDQYGTYGDTILAGIDWITKHAVHPAVVNVSLGSTGIWSSGDNAVKNSIATGITYVVSAGNSTTNACNVTFGDILPAIVAAGSNSSDGLASWSNYGPCVDVIAPGAGIYSSYKTSDTSYATMSGTSMAAPHVTGVAALYLQNHPSASPAEVENAIKSSATMGLFASLPTGTPNALLYSLISGSYTPPSDTTAPSAPGSLAATTLSTSVRLTWTNSTDNVGVVGYKVFKNGTQVGTVTTNSYADASVTSGTTYSYYVKAYDAAGNVSAASNTVSVTVPVAAFAITGFTVAQGHGNPHTTPVTMTWSTNYASTGTVTYGSPAVTVPFTTSATNHSAVISGLVTGTSYTYTITAARTNSTDTATQTGTFVGP